MLAFGKLPNAYRRFLRGGGAVWKSPNLAYMIFGLPLVCGSNSWYTDNPWKWKFIIPLDNNSQEIGFLAQESFKTEVVWFDSIYDDKCFDDAHFNVVYFDCVHSKCCIIFLILYLWCNLPKLIHFWMNVVYFDRRALSKTYEAYWDGKLLFTAKYSNQADAIMNQSPAKKRKSESETKNMFIRHLWHFFTTLWHIFKAFALCDKIGASGGAATGSWLFFWGCYEAFVRLHYLFLELLSQADISCGRHLRETD